MPQLFFPETLAVDELSGLIDNTVLLHYALDGNAVRRRLAVLKVRDSDFDHRSREFRIDGTGLNFDPPDDRWTLEGTATSGAVPRGGPGGGGAALMARVLLVEDEAMLLLFASMTLEDDGHEVRTASNGRRGLERARAEKIDVIVTDFMMPEMDGLAMLAALRAEGRDVPAIMVTAIPRDQLPIMDGPPFDDYMGKPYDETALAERIRALVNGES